MILCWHFLRLIYIIEVHLFEVRMSQQQKAGSSFLPPHMIVLTTSFSQSSKRCLRLLEYLPSITGCEHLIGFNVNSQMIYHFIDIMRLINPLPSWVLSNAFLFKIWWYNLIFDIKPYGYRCKFDVHIYKDGPVKTALIGEIYLPITPCCLVQLTSINNFRTLYTPRDMNHLPISEHNWVFQIYWEHILSSCYFNIVEWSYF